MNRLFGFTLAAFSLLLGVGFVLLIGSAIFRLAASHYFAVPRLGEIIFSVRLSLYTATVASTLAVLCGLPIAYFLSRNEFHGKTLLDTLLDLPVVLSPIALGALLLVFFNTPFGEVIERFFGPFVFEVRGIILAQFVVVVGLAIRLLKNSFESVDVEYEEIARTLGCNRFYAFVRVTLPLARRGLLASWLLVWGRAIGEFGATVTLAGATTMKTETIPVAIALSFESADVSIALVFILILVGVSLLVLYALRKAGSYVIR